MATRWYRAPELLIKEVLYEATVDVWAVGCLLPEMLTGEPLFPGDSGKKKFIFFRKKNTFQSHIKPNVV